MDVVVVTETDIFISNVAGNARCRSCCEPAGLNRLVHDLEHAFAGGATRLQQLIELMELPNWFVKISRQQQKRAELAQLHRAAKNSARSDKNRNDNSDRAD